MADKDDAKIERHTYVVQMLFGVDVETENKREACELALAELAHRCQYGPRDIHIRAEQYR